MNHSLMKYWWMSLDLNLSLFICYLSWFSFGFRIFLIVLRKVFFFECVCLTLVFFLFSYGFKISFWQLIDVRPKTRYLWVVDFRHRLYWRWPRLLFDLNISIFTWLWDRFWGLFNVFYSIYISVWLLNYGNGAFVLFVLERWHVVFGSVLIHVPLWWGVEAFLFIHSRL